MHKNQKITKCYIASYKYPNQDIELQNQEISNGLLTFAIPEFGVLFRCLGEGQILNMEFSVFFSLIEFILSKLNDEKIDTIQVLSSNPHFVFSFTSYADCLKEGTTYRKMLESYMQKISIQVGYVKPQKNQALYSTADYPSIPRHKTIDLKLNKDDLTKSEFKIIQKGIKL